MIGITPLGTIPQVRGVEVNLTTNIMTNTGNILLNGTNRSTGIQSQGITIINSSTITSNISGDIVLHGTNIATPGSSTNASDGLRIRSSAAVRSLGTGSISITGSTGTDNGDGITIDSIVSSVDGDITMIGSQFGSNNNNNNNGILFSNIATLVSCSGAGAISITGTSTVPNNSGILISGGSIVTTNTGAIVLEGTKLATAGTGVQLIGPISTITSTNGPIQITGTAAGGTLEGIIVDSGATVVSNGLGSIAMQTFSDLLVQNGSSISALGTGDITLDVSTDLVVLGGAGANAPAFISITDGSGLFRITRDLIVTGGLGSDSPAFIGNNMALNASGSMEFSIGGNCTLTGQTSFAQVGHVNQAGAALGGNVSMTTGGNIDVVGGTALAAYARIGHGGQAGGAMFNASSIQLIAGVDLTMTSNTGEAQIVNPNGPLTLVVDNLFPVSPGIGFGGFFLNSTLSATGELRIYTARRSQNVINDLINGVPFIPGPFDIDTSTEQWAIYFPEGTYGTTAFKFYYKEGTKKSSNIPFKNIAANLAQLSDLLPVLRSQRSSFVFPNYHFQLCEQDELSKICNPTFSPYGSFIFEDDVYWIGTSFL